jgi:Flp pilus assembly CpaE family ATPase
MEKVQLRKEDVWQTSPGSPYAAALKSLAWRLTTRCDPVPARGGGLFGRFFKSAEERAMREVTA